MGNPFSSRRKRLIRQLNNLQISHVLIIDPANIFYYTGYNSDPHERFMGLFFDLVEDTEVLFVPTLDWDLAKSNSDISNVVPISDEQVPFQVVYDTVGEIYGKIGIEGKALSYRRLLEFQKTFNQLSLFDIQSIIENERMIKSNEEIIYLKQALKTIETVLADGIKRAKIGMTETELAAELEYLMRLYGADGPSFSSIVLAGENAALPHGKPSSRKLQSGDLLLIDFGVSENGYCSDITRTFVINQITEQQQRLYDIVLSANNAAISKVKKGIPLKEFDLAARNVIKQHGYGEFFNNRVGHGIGIEVHEEPSIHEKNEIIAKEGMVFTIEPGIYIPNEIGIRIEDTVYINDQGGVETLSTFPKELQIILGN